MHPHHNYAKGRPVSASGSHNSGSGPERAVDGDRRNDSCWESDALPAWIEVEQDSASGSAAGGGWRVDLQLARRGDFVGPVEVELEWSDGTTERRTWNGEERWVRWRIEGPRRLEQVVIDPDIVWALETRRADNYWRARPAGLDHPLWWLREGIEFARHLFLRFN